MQRHHHRRYALVLLLAGLGVARADDVDALPARAAVAARQAIGYLTREVAVNGGYPQQVTGDGVHRFEGLGLSPTSVAVGPGATAELGLAALAVSQATDAPECLAAALAAARCLARGQLASGGWPRLFDTGGESDGYTRVLAASSVPQGERRNESSYLPEATPAALRLLLEVGAVTSDRELLDAARYAVRGLLQAQLATGGWPAVTPLPDDNRRWTAFLHGVTPAVLQVLLRAAELGYPGAADSAAQGAEALLAARLPQPWPFWPAFCEAGLQADSGSLHLLAALDACDALLQIARQTGEERYVVDLPVVLAALEALRGEDQHWPASVQPGTGAAVEGAPRLDLTARIGALQSGLRQPLAAPGEPGRAERRRLTRQRAPQAATLVAEFAEVGVWRRDGSLWLADWASHLQAIADYLRDYQPLDDPTDREDPRPPQHRRP